MKTTVAHTQLLRLVGSTVVGVAGGLAGSAIWHAAWGPMVGWVAGAATHCAWTWLLVGRFDPDDTRSLATSEDPGRAVGDLVLIVASLAAVVGVGLLLLASSEGTQGTPAAVLGVLGVVASWAVVHTLFALRYARLYYEAGGRGVDFGDDQPDYGDFAYLAFTLGMTYQVSDTTLQTRAIRRTALRHGLLSFLLGAVILACTINLVVQLASAGG